MAIKGKGRTRSRRVVASPPRPQLVVRKPPIWRRPWFLIAFGVVAMAGILIAVFTGIHSSNVKKLKDDLLQAGKSPDTVRRVVTTLGYVLRRAHGSGASSTTTRLMTPTSRARGVASLTFRHSSRCTRSPTRRPTSARAT